jgi:4-hydroxybenzoate polyprenyltransferase/phosphoglycolate phosphatase-like HAD superfamily hydrolase
MSSPSVAPAVPATADYRVLFVDLDGSLLATDVTMESLFRAVKIRPAVLLQALVWVLRGGRPLMKRRLLEIAPITETHWPYCQEVVALLRKHRQEGCHLVLATASDRAIAQRVADDLGLFDAVLATDGKLNLKGPNKLLAMEAYCREHGFETFAYLGDSPADLPIWRRSAMAFAVAPGTLLQRRIDSLGVPTQVVAANPSRWRDLLRALRPHQWSKNLLIFLPTFLAHDLSPVRLCHALMGFLSFSACASAVYLTNDLLDLETDRRHPTKRARPIPAGKLRLSTVALTVPILTALAFVLAMGTARWRFCAILLMYLGASGLYSFWLKRKAVIDVFLLSGLYILRVQAGGDAAGVPVSEWMLEFSLFFFLSLAFAKRFIELDRLELAADTHHTGRGYQSVDVPTIFTLGPASGYIATLVFALYLNSPQVALLYTRPKILWLLCPILLFWITRLWLLARRKELHDDPVVFALKDRMSLLLGALSAAVVLLAWLLGARHS